MPSDIGLDSRDEVVQAVFEGFRDNIGDVDYFKSRILLAATNEIVNNVNDEIMAEHIPGEIQTYTSADDVGDIDSATMFPTEFPNSLSLSSLSEHKRKLKVNTIVILLRNINIKAAHCCKTNIDLAGV